MKIELKDTKYGCLVLLLVFIMSSIIGAFCWTYTLNTWLVFFGKTAKVMWWQGALLGFVPYLGQLSIGAAVITWIFMLFV